jgi:predicted RNA-binding protein YlqC (UPF0109 family)
VEGFATETKEAGKIINTRGRKIRALRSQSKDESK